MDVSERPADLLFWLRDGCSAAFGARVRAEVEVSIGRTDSKRGLGFVVARRGGGVLADFVLNKDQVNELAVYLGLAERGLLKPLGKKPQQISLVAMTKNFRTQNAKIENRKPRTENREKSKNRISKREN